MKNKRGSFFFSLKDAARGIRSALRSERHMRYHLWMALAAVFLGWLVRLTSLEWVLVTLCIGVVLGAELFNTALELLVNQISPEWKPELGRIKDISAGAVLVVSLASLISGLLLYGRAFLRLL